MGGIWDDGRRTEWPRPPNTGWTWTGSTWVQTPVAYQISDATDGTSNTMMLAERLPSIKGVYSDLFWGWWDYPTAWDTRVAGRDTSPLYYNSFGQPSQMVYLGHRWHPLERFPEAHVKLVAGRDYRIEAVMASPRTRRSNSGEVTPSSVVQCRLTQRPRASCVCQR